jgi:hypothetical protein
LFDATKPCKLGGEITSAREDQIMVAVHPGMSDQTSTNIARDGAAKRTQSKSPVKEGMKNQTEVLSGVSPANPGVGPDADPANPLSPEAKQKHSGPIDVKWGMEKSPTKHDPALGSAVLKEAANLGR